MYDIVIIGAGPAGLMATYTLLTKSDKKLNIALVDRGNKIENRVCPMREDPNQPCVHCKPCNIMNGFGGAGTFSDCKLSLTPFGVGGDIVNFVGGEEAKKLINKVEAIYDKFDVDSDKRKVIGLPTKETDEIESRCYTYNITYTPCPTKHLGTDGTLNVMKEMSKFITLQVDYFDKTSVYSVNKLDDGTYNICIDTNKFDSTRFLILSTKYVIIAPGRSGNTWLKELCENLDIPMVKNKVDVGVRVETKAEYVSKLTDNLYDMKFSDGNCWTKNKIRTFCTNPKGYVSEEHYGKNAVVNGHSFADKKSENTNFALLVTLDDELLTSDYANALVELSNKVSGGKIICQNYLSFENEVKGKFAIPGKLPTIKPTLTTAVEGNLANILPSSVCTMIVNFMKKLSYISNQRLTSENTILYGIETKFYSDKVVTNNDFSAVNQENIYCIGDGAGITRGIMQAASTGIVAAESILNKI